MSETKSAVKSVIVVIGAGSIGQAIARRVSAGKHVLLADLRQEREQIEEAIITLERLARGRSKRRGRPPKNPYLVPAPATGRTRRPRTAAQKKAQSEKMKKYWAQRKKQKKA